MYYNGLDGNLVIIGERISREPSCGVSDDDISYL